MPQTISSIILKSQIQGSMTATGTAVQNAIRIGKLNSVSLSSSDVDILYALKITAGHADNQATWPAPPGDITSSGSGTALTCTETLSDTEDAEGNDIAAHVNIVAIYYETDTDNTGDVTIAGSATMGIVTLGSGGSNARSALFVPRAAASGQTVTIDFSAANDDVTMVVMANSS